jgi:hypothetical protein
MYTKLIKGIKGICFFTLGNLFAVFTYDRKYLKGKYFAGKFFGISAKGWRWVVTDCSARILLGINRGVPFPVSPLIKLTDFKNLKFDIDDLNNFQGMGKYFQASSGGQIIIGKGSWIGPNVGIIASNHDVNDPASHLPGKDIILGENCWIGMNSVILPGITLGPHTTVGAGTVVTKSFPEGYCVIVGNPAKKVRNIEMFDNMEIKNL